MAKNVVHNCDHCALKRIDDKSSVAPNYCAIRNEHWSKKDRKKPCRDFVGRKR